MPRIHKYKGQYILKDYKPNTVNDMWLDCDVNNSLEVDVRLLDKRHITEQQRKFIFALCNEIAYFTGDDKEYIRLLLAQYNANLRQIEVESLSSCSMTYANGLIDTIIDFCIEREIPISGDVVKDNQYTFNSKQVYMMCLKRVCVVCGARADLHHVQALGRGNNRTKEIHVGREILPLCRAHHNEIHTIGNEKFMDKYHVIPTVCDEKLQYFILKGKVKVFKDE